MAKDKEITVKMTPTDIIELIEQKTGLKITTDEYWFQTVIENTRELPPYSLVTFKAHKR